MYVCSYLFVYVLTYANIYVDLCMYVCSYVFMNAHIMCVSISPNDDDIYYIQKSVSISVKSREHQKRTQSLYHGFKLLSELGDFVFCVQLGSLYKIVALTGPYRTSLNVMQVCVFIYACMYVRMCLCMYLRSQICM